MPNPDNPDNPNPPLLSYWPFARSRFAVPRGMAGRSRSRGRYTHSSELGLSGTLGLGTAPNTRLERSVPSVLPAYGGATGDTRLGRRPQRPAQRPRPAAEPTGGDRKLSPVAKPETDAPAEYSCGRIRNPECTHAKHTIRRATHRPNRHSRATRLGRRGRRRA